MIDKVVSHHNSMEDISVLKDITNSDNGNENSENTSECVDDNDNFQMINSELMTTDEKWKLIYSEQTRAPLHAVGHYINHIKKQIDEKGQKHKTKKLKDGIHPLSYLLRKLKLDLKMSYESFVSEFVRVPNNGLLLLVRLLKQLQSPHRSKSTSVSGKESRLEEYKRQLADEHDCLLCIKFTLRSQMAVEQLAKAGDNLQIIGNSLMSSTIKSRVATLEILTLTLSVSEGFEKVFETFIHIRLKYGEPVKFKLLVSMLYTQGYGQVIFQVAAMRFLNTLLAACNSGNFKVYLQEEIRLAGLDIDVLEKNTRGDGLEYDDLRREIEEWKYRIIDVDCLLRKPKHDMWYQDPNQRFTDGDPRLIPSGHTYNQNQNRQLPSIPIQNISELPPSSIEMIMNILHRHNSQTTSNFTGEFPNTSHRESMHDVDDITSDYNTDQENYIAHVYKNTDGPLDHPQQRRRSEDLTSRNKLEENIYETLNTKPRSLRNEGVFDPVGSAVYNRRNSKKRLGSINGNWILQRHLSMPSLNETTHNQSHTDVSQYQNKTQSNGRDISDHSNECGEFGILPEPVPDYSPEITRSSVLGNTSEAFLVLDEFDEMLEKHESKPTSNTTKRSDYVSPGTITYV